MEKHDDNSKYESFTNHEAKELGAFSEDAITEDDISPEEPVDE